MFFNTSEWFLMVFVGTIVSVAYCEEDNAQLDFFPPMDLGIGIKTEIDEGFYETCEMLNTTGLYLNKDQDLKVNLEGQITVFFRLVPYYLYQNQVAMIRQIRNRFDEFGYNAIQFIIVVAYMKNPKIRARILEELETVADDIDIIYETEDSNHILGMGNNQAYIVDQCRRLTYIIVPPWSHIQFPYVKAAILSSIYDAPCGECANQFILQPYPGYYENIEFIDISTPMETEAIKTPTTTEETPTTTTETEAETSTTFYNQIEDIVEQEEEDIYMTAVENNLHLINESDVIINESDADDSSTASDDAFAIPLRIILPVEHVHHDPIKDSYMKYNYIVLNTGDETFHGHVGAQEMVQRVTEDATEYHSLLNEIDGVGTELYVNRAGQIYQLLKQYQVANVGEFNEVTLLETDIVRDEPSITPINKQANLRIHYDQLVQWLTWQFE